MNLANLNYDTLAILISATVSLFVLIGIHVLFSEEDSY